MVGGLGLVGGLGVRDIGGLAGWRADKLAGYKALDGFALLSLF